MRWLSRFVTVAVILTVIGGAVWLLRAKMPATHVGQDFQTYALFRDGSRLATGSPVMIAGVRIGEISRLGIERGFARVELALRDDTNILVDSWVTKRAESAFGDSYIEIIPTGGEEGAPLARPLRSGEPLTHVIEGSSTDAVLRAIGRTMPKVDNAVAGIHDFMIDGRRWVNGTLNDRIKTVDTWLQEGRLDGPIENADRSMARVETATTAAAEAVSDAKPTVTRTLDRFDRGIASAREQIASVKKGIVDGLTNAREGLDRVDKPIADMRDVMVAIDEGSGADWKGTLGRLINTPDVANTIEDVTGDAREGLANYVGLKSYLGVRFEYNVFARVPRVYVTAELETHADTFFLVELVKSNLGARPNDDLSDVVGSGSFDRTTVIEDKLRFTLEFGKRLGPFRLRAGFKESTFGAGTDVLLMGNRLMLSADAYGSFTPTPYIKIAGAFAVFSWMYINAGISDVFNSPGYLPIVDGNTNVPIQFDTLRYGRDYFLGATLKFTDADFSTLLKVYGTILTTALF
ncbi:MAG TPA: MlaD family protein [Kofleriaceae bacterium]|nr:MlaD family protein [Kofleriaceae bacterium]